MTLPDALTLIFAANPNKYRRERWRYARGKLDVKAQVVICEKEGYTVNITVNAPSVQFLADHINQSLKK